MLLVGSGFGFASPMATGPNEDEVVQRKYQLSFLRNCAKEFGWPSERLPDATAPIVIAVVGDDPFGRLLDELGTLEVHRKEDGVTRALKVIRITSLDAPDFEARLRSAHIAFVDDSAQPHMAQVAAIARAGHVLTVAGHHRFLGSGGMVRYAMVRKPGKSEGRMAWAVNRKAIVAADIRCPSLIYRNARPDW